MKDQFELESNTGPLDYKSGILHFHNLNEWVRMQPQFKITKLQILEMKNYREKILTTTNQLFYSKVTLSLYIDHFNLLPVLFLIFLNLFKHSLKYWLHYQCVHCGLTISCCFSSSVWNWSGDGLRLTGDLGLGLGAGEADRLTGAGECSLSSSDSYREK